MTAYADACRNPFSNGTEGYAWMTRWCAYCARNHGEHVDALGRPDDEKPWCDIITDSMFDHPWPEAWIPEPDDGRYFLPSRMCCLAFTPCEPCGGDPGAIERADRITEVQAYWREREAT